MQMWSSVSYIWNTIVGNVIPPIVSSTPHGSISKDLWKTDSRLLHSFDPTNQALDHTNIIKAIVQFRNGYSLALLHREGSLEIISDGFMFDPNSDPAQVSPYSYLVLNI
jgi:hypothetical protein